MDDSTSRSLGKASGTFLGHFIPAVFFLGFMSFYLILTFVRMRRLAINGEAATSGAFCEHHIPERNYKLLRIMSWVIMVSTFVGIIYEGVGATVVNYMHNENNTFFTNLTHQTLYLLFCLAGLVGVCESHGRLPPDSMRKALVLAFLGETLLWHEHALMKTDHVDNRVHTLLAVSTMLISIFLILSIVKPKSILFYVAFLCCGILQGTWLVTAALAVSSPPDMERVASGFVLQVMAIAFVVILATVHINGLERRASQQVGIMEESDALSMGKSGKSQYNKLQVYDEQEDDEEDDAEFGLQAA